MIAQLIAAYLALGITLTPSEAQTLVSLASAQRRLLAQISAIDISYRQGHLNLTCCRSANARYAFISQRLLNCYRFSAPNPPTFRTLLIFVRQGRFPLNHNIQDPEYAHVAEVRAIVFNVLVPPRREL